LKLLLFDIDGTLMRTGGAGRISMERAFKSVYGVRNGFEGIHMMGRTDPVIVREALCNHGLTWQDDQVESFRRLYYEILTEQIKQPLADKGLCPGIPELLEAIQATPALFLGLLTGNWRRSAMMKLDYFGIRPYFPAGAFADDSEKREDLVAVVVERMLPFTGKMPDPSQVIVIGDTPMDVACAKPYGAKSVAVATGFHSPEVLKAARPDRIFSNLADTKRVLAYFKD